MINYVRTEEFFKTFSDRFPNLEIIEWRSLTKGFILKDAEGFLHFKKPAKEIFRYGLSIKGVLEKEKYIQNKIDKKGNINNIKILKYIEEKKIIVIDKNGFTYTTCLSNLLVNVNLTIECCNEKVELFKFKANLKHNNFYTYNLEVYKNGNDRVKIICPIHGEFEQLAESHLCGRGCSLCNRGGFTKEIWKKRAKGRNCIFYIIKLYNINEEFVKIGITYKSIEHRYRELKAYKYEIIKTVSGDAFSIYDIEKKFLKKYGTRRYLPSIRFNGLTECFSMSILDEILKDIEL